MARNYRAKRKTPAHRRKRTYARRPGYRRRRHAVPKTLSLARIGSGLPSQLYMKHHYRETAIDLNSSTLGYAQAIYRINSLFDPRYATGGNQPTLRDNLFQLYNHARVVSAKVTAYFYNTGGLHQRCGIVYTTNAADTPFIPYTTTDLMALPRDRLRYTTMSEYQGSKTFAKLTKVFNFKHYESDLFSSINYRQDSAGNPAKELYVIMGSQCVDVNADLQCRGEIDIEFTVRWEDPVNAEMTAED